MSYVEVYVAPVPTEQKETYMKHCANMNAVFKEHGALRAVDSWGAEVPDGEVTSFPIAVQANEGETVCIGWVEWPDKQSRDTGMEAAMADKRMQEEFEHMPFDGKRLIYAGFEVFNDS